MIDYRVHIKHPVNNLAVFLGPHKYTNDAKIPFNFRKGLDNNFDKKYPDLDIDETTPWECWNNIIEKNLDLSSSINIHTYDSNKERLECAIDRVARHRPAFCFVLLDDWFKINLNWDIEVDMDETYPNNDGFITNLKQKTQIRLQNLMHFNREYSFDIFVLSTIKKLYTLLLVCKEFNTKLTIGQTVAPFGSLHTSYRQQNDSMYMVYSRLQELLDNMHDLQKHLFNFYTLGFPFTNSKDQLVNIEDFKNLVPNCHDFLNEHGQYSVAKKLTDHALWQDSEDGLNFLYQRQN